MKIENRIEELRELKKLSEKGGNQAKTALYHKQGRLTARERINYLLDTGTFVEANMLLNHLETAPGDGIVCGHGLIDGRRVCIYSQDSTVMGGSVGPLHGYKMYKTVERAVEMRVPLIGLHDSPGARLPRISEKKSVHGDVMEKTGASVFYPNTSGSGLIPQIAAIMGTCAGLSVYSPALADFIFMVEKQSHMFITGPSMVKTVTGEDVAHEELGGARVHCEVSGVADARFANDKGCLDKIRELLTFFPANCEEKPPVVQMNDDSERLNEDLVDIVGFSSRKPYDMHKVIQSIVDQRQFFEIKAEFAREVIVGFARMDNETVGIVGNQPTVRAGCLTVDSSDKQTRFMRFCDCFNIPIILLVDTPAYLPGRIQEHKGIIRHGAKVLYALCESRVPRIAVVLRKCYGGGNLAMGVMPGLGTDLVYYWPTVEVGILGAEASVELYFGSEIAKAEKPDVMRSQKIKEFEEQYSNPMREISANWGIEDIIEPRHTRTILIKGLTFLSSKKRNRSSVKHHGNIPM